MIYLDHAAATPVDSDVLAAMQPYFSDVFYNPSATYLPARQAREALEAARGSVAHWLGVRPTEVIFTAGGTEGNNLAVAGVMANFPNCSAAVSAIEHESVLAAAQQFNCSVAFVTEQGRVDPGSLRQKIADNTVLVSVMYANNEVGTTQPLRQISAVLAEIRTERKKAGNDLPLYFHTDACQAANYLSLSVASLGVDLMTLNGGKIYGQKQTGVIYAASSVKLSPIIRGGGQERGLRSGTENVAGAVGFAKALEQAQSVRQFEATRLNEVKNVAIRLLSQKIPGVIINGSLKYRLPNNIHITLPGFDNERVLIQLEERGFLAAAGSACSASSEEPSHVLRAMGVSDDAARSSLRITMGRSTTMPDIERFIQALTEITKVIRTTLLQITKISHIS
ncbi:cysteine desulfurase [Candidatus Saccharibacteria bacterium]|nr:MAG: cysteine desulfurase [Candidatus Saccharibacteria bacterium]